MKTLVSMTALLLSFSFSAHASSIDCDNNSNSDEMITLRIEDGSSRILGASIYNVDWSQTAEATYQDATAIGTTNPMRGYTVILKDGQTLDVDYSVLEPSHDGVLTLNGTTDYHCY